MSPLTIGLIGIVFLFILVFLGIPIAYSMTIAGFVGFVYLASIEGGLRIVGKDFYANFASYTLTVIPLFVWMGFLALHAGIGSRLFDAAYKLVGRLRGGLAMAAEVACGLFGAICGSTTATTATIGSVALPEMKKFGYAPWLSTASIASGGILGVLIPPSTVFIVYSVCTEQSIAKLFISGIFPGILLCFLYMATIWVLVRINPSIAPPGPKFSLKEKVLAFGGGSAETIIIFMICMGGLFAGVFTPTEAGAVGAFTVLMVALARRKLNWKGFVGSLSDTTKTTAMILLLVAGAVVFGRFIAVSRIPAELASWISGLNVPRDVVFWLIMLIYLMLGTFIDALAMILLTIPIFYPVILSLGYDPIWFGVIIVLVCGMGVITPPVGMNVYVIAGIAKDVPLFTIFKGIWPFVGAQIVCIAIVFVFPQIATWLPQVLMP